MFTFNVERYVPAFILNDKNGRAVAKAIEAAMQYMNDRIFEGVRIIYDYDVMPEWRLDELAWEYNIPYDYTADVETKRKWVSEAYTLSRMIGTKESIIKYMEAFFDTATLEEYWEYGGDPFHFRMSFEGFYTQEKTDWITMVVNKAKSLRSILDKYTFNASMKHNLQTRSAIYEIIKGKYQVSMENTAELDCYCDENGDMLLDERRYPLIVEG